MPTASKTEENASTISGSDIDPPSSGSPGADYHVVSRDQSVSSQALEASTQKIGRELFERIGRGPKPWQRAWWEEKFIAGTLDDPLVRVQLFRFIDALPALKTTDSVRRHLAEYLAEAGERVPWWLSVGLRLAPAGTQRAEWLAEAARASAGVMARKFIAGATPDEARETVIALRDRRLAFTADLLGEAVISEAEADLYQETCLALIRGLDAPLKSAALDPLIDRDQHGPLPRVNLSLKLSSLTAQFDAIHAEATIARVAGRLRPILRTARDLGAYIHVDMEQYDYRAISYELFCRVLLEPDFRDWPDVGIVVQAYHGDAENELRVLREWALRRGAPITIRLVKGAYWDFEVATAPVGLARARFSREVAKRCVLRALRPVLDRTPRAVAPGLRQPQCPQPGARDRRREARGLPNSAYELQTLYGMGDLIQRALVDRGHRVRVYTPYGAILPGMAYLVRRLLENTSNESFLKASFAESAQIEDLLRDPEEIGAMMTRTRSPKTEASTAAGGTTKLPPFHNEPPTDFARAENRESFRRALDLVRTQLGRRYSLSIGGKEVDTGSRLLDSVNPSQSSRVVGQVSLAGVEHAEAAVAAARSAFPAWAATPAMIRAAILIKAAGIMRNRRFELAAWEVYECGKPWAEADGDVAEAIDFCEFYAREMIRLAEPRHRDAGGETNYTEHIPRGVAVVIPPWNFPLAIPTGMTVAALVAGNTVILKPAEQSPVITWQLARVLNEAGLPPGVLNFLPGLGEEVGQALVNHPDIDVVAFTGSRDVGLLINRQAALVKPGQNHLKRVIAEMGGKNAILVDDDADLDEAVVGVIHSAFGYAGQKCSACSRVIVLEGIYDAFRARLVEAARAVKVGPADDPETLVGPVIDADARRRILDYQRIAATEGRVVFHADAGPLADQGYFVGPMIVADVLPGARVAQEEIFGPVLAVLKAKDLGDALQIANGTAYALTGGVYSRSPANIDRVRREFLVGNLYINRGITGAQVDRQPFGGFKLSGIGTKAGGPDYLLEFLLTRSITENTMRRGFAPEDAGAENA